MTSLFESSDLWAMTVVFLPTLAFTLAIFALGYQAGSRRLFRAPRARAGQVSTLSLRPSVRR